jgi:hypothetical protein
VVVVVVVVAVVVVMVVVVVVAMVVVVDVRGRRRVAHVLVPGCRVSSYGVMAV